MIKNDVLLVVDAQRDFVHGSLAVPGAVEALEVMDDLIMRFYHARMNVLYTGCRHPAEHCSFLSQRGDWPVHCVAGTIGADIIAKTPYPRPEIFWKGESRDVDEYSGFANPRLRTHLDEIKVNRLVVCGLATDYCVKHTVLDACKLGYDVVLVIDAIAAVTEPGRIQAEAEMNDASARFRTARWVEVV